MHHSPVFSCWMQDATAQDVPSIYLLLQRFAADALVVKASAKQIMQSIACFSVAHSHYIPDHKTKHNGIPVVNRKNQFLPQVVGCCAIVPVKTKQADKQFLNPFANGADFRMRGADFEQYEKTNGGKNGIANYFFLELRSVAVDSSFQSGGVGRRLVEYALRKVKHQLHVFKNETSCKTIHGIKLKTKNVKDNARAFDKNTSDFVAIVFCLSKRGSFFEKMGFEVTSRVDIPFDESDDPRYLATRELRGVKLYSKRLSV